MKSYWSLTKAKPQKTAVPTWLRRVRAVRLGEWSRCRSSFARVFLLARTSSPVVKLLTIWLLASSENAHWPPCLFYHVHNTVQHLDDDKQNFINWDRFNYLRNYLNLTSLSNYLIAMSEVSKSTYIIKSRTSFTNHLLDLIEFHPSKQLNINTLF